MVDISSMGVCGEVGFLILLEEHMGLVCGRPFGWVGETLVILDTKLGMGK